MSLPDDQVEDLVRAMLEAELGPDDPPLSEDDLAFMVPLMGSALNRPSPSTKRSRSSSRMASGSSAAASARCPTEPDYGFEPSVSSEGLCGLATPAELSTLSALQYDSSNGFEAYCAYTTSDFEDYHTTTVNFVPNQDAETNAGYYGADQPLEVGGAPAYATDPASFGTQLITQVGRRHPDGLCDAW